MCPIPGPTRACARSIHRRVLRCAPHTARQSCRPLEHRLLPCRNWPGRHPLGPKNAASWPVFAALAAVKARCGRLGCRKTLFRSLRWPNGRWPGEKTAYFPGKTGQMARHGIWPPDPSELDPSRIRCVPARRDLARRVAGRGCGFPSFRRFGEFSPTGNQSFCISLPQGAGSQPLAIHYPEAPPPA